MTASLAAAPIASTSILYEVDLEIDADVAAEYRAWLDAHIDEILALPGFTGASLATRLDPPPAAGRISLVVAYRLVDEAALTHYFAEHAPRLREEGLKRFDGRFAASGARQDSCRLNFKQLRRYYGICTEVLMKPSGALAARGSA